MTRRCNQPPLGSNTDGDNDTAAFLHAIADVADDFTVRYAAIDGEMTLQPFRECWPRASPRDFDRSAPVGIAQTHKREVEVQ